MAVVFVKVRDVDNKPHVIRLDSIKIFTYNYEDNTTDLGLADSGRTITVGNGYDVYTLFTNLFALEQSIVDVHELVELNDNLEKIVTKQIEVDGEAPLLKVIRNVDESLKHLEIVAERRKQEKEMVKQMGGQMSMDFGDPSKIN